MSKNIKKTHGLESERDDRISIMMDIIAESDKRVEENREIKYNILNSGWDVNMLGLLIPDLPPIEFKTLLYTDYEFSTKQQEAIAYYITLRYPYSKQPELKGNIYTNKKRIPCKEKAPINTYTSLGVSSEFLSMLYSKEVKVPEKFAIAFNKRYHKLTGITMFINEQIVNKDVTTTDTLKKLINDIGNAKLNAKELRILAAQCEIYAKIYELIN